jgi:heptosyltransferase II
MPFHCKHQLATFATMQKVLFIQTAFIGDVVLATGLLETWHQQFPQHQIDVLVRKGNETLLANHPFVHKVLIWNKQQNKYKHLWQVLQQIRQQQYHIVFTVQRFAATGFLAAFSNATYKVGFTKNPFSFLFTHRIQHIISNQNISIVHEVERNHALLQPFTKAAVGMPALYPTIADFNSVSMYTQQPYICIAPSSVWYTKQFPIHKWIECINQLPTTYTIYLLGAKGDATICNEIKQQCNKHHIVNLAGLLSFLQSAALQKNAVMNFVNDSAPMHFASAVNAPVTAIYCSTIPTFGFGPLSSNSHIVQTNQVLTCRPCGLHGKKACPQQHFNCATQIQPKQLVAVLPGA